MTDNPTSTDQTPNPPSNPQPNQPPSDQAERSTPSPTEQPRPIPKSQTLRLPLPLAKTLPYLTGVLPYGAWILGLIMLILEHDPKVRFHALQAVILFGALELARFLLGQTVLFSGLSNLLYLGQFVLWLMLVYTTYQSKGLRLPVIAPWIDKQFGK